MHLLKVAHFGPKIAVAVLVVLCLIPVLVAYSTRSGPSYDDAYITLTYARNVAEGKGFVYNGGVPYLGTTTPGLSLTLAALKRLLPAYDIPVLAHWLGTLMWVLSTVLAYLIGRHLGGVRVGLILAALNATAGVYALYLRSEYPLLIALSLAGIYLAMRRRAGAAGVVLGLAFIVRNDAAVLVGLIFVALWWEQRRLPWRFAIGFGLTVLPWLLYAILTFGSPFPATLAVKRAHQAIGVWPPLTIGFTRWLETVDWWSQARLILTVLLSLAVLVYALRKGQIWTAVLVVWAGLYIAAYVILNVPFYAWYTAVPIVAFNLGAGLALAVLWTRRTPQTVWRLLAVLCLTALLVVAAENLVVATRNLRIIRPKTQAYLDTATWLREHTPADSTVGFIEIGWIGYYSQRQIIDLLGLSTPGVTPYLEKRDHAGILEAMQPDYYVRNTNFDNWNMNRSVEESCYFRANYRPINTIPQSGTSPVVIYHRQSQMQPAAETALLDRILEGQGKHLSLEGRPGFPAADETTIRATVAASPNVWVYVPTVSTPEDDHFRRWLLEQGALQLCTADASVYWLSVSPIADRLAFLQEHGLFAIVDPSDAVLLWRQRGEELRTGNKFAEAETAYHQALTWAPQDEQSLVGLSAALMGMGRQQEALPLLKQAAKLKPGDYWVHRLTGNAYAQLGNLGLAQKELTTAYAINVADPVLLLDLARVQARMGLKDQALRTLDTLRKREDGARFLADIETLRNGLGG